MQSRGGLPLSRRCSMVFLATSQGFHVFHQPIWSMFISSTIFEVGYWSHMGHILVLCGSYTDHLFASLTMLLPWLIQVQISVSRLAVSMFRKVCYKKSSDCLLQILCSLAETANQSKSMQLIPDSTKGGSKRSWNGSASEIKEHHRLNTAAAVVFFGTSPHSLCGRGLCAWGEVSLVSLHRNWVQMIEFSQISM
jgi:hypothetical protein